jgi:hypothetical protein
MIEHRVSSIQDPTREPTVLDVSISYHGITMSKKPRKKKKSTSQRRGGAPKKNTKYTPGEIAMAVLGAALLIMVAGIIITSLLG